MGETFAAQSTFVPAALAQTVMVTDFSGVPGTHQSNGHPQIIMAAATTQPPKEFADELTSAFDEELRESIPLQDHHRQYVEENVRNLLFKNGYLVEILHNYRFLRSVFS